MSSDTERVAISISIVRHLVSPYGEGYGTKLSIIHFTHAYELVLWLTMPVFSAAVGALVLVLV